MSTNKLYLVRGCYIQCITAPRFPQTSVWPFLTFKFKKITNSKSKINNDKFKGLNPSISIGYMAIGIIYILADRYNINTGNVIGAQMIALTQVLNKHTCHIINSHQ